MKQFNGNPANDNTLPFLLIKVIYFFIHLQLLPVISYIIVPKTALVENLKK